jgi:hypothetical protein
MRHTILFFALLAGGCTREVLTGDGQVKTEQRPVSAFTELHLDVPAQLELRQTGKESLRLECDGNLSAEISSTVEGGRLRISTVRHSVELRPSKPIRLNVEVKQLNLISMAGSGKITFARLSGEQLTLQAAGSGSIDGAGLAVASLNASLAGSGQMRLEGNVPAVQLSLSGSGVFDGGNLTADKAAVSITGAGDVTLAVKQQLTASITGSGNLHYLGSPSVQQNVTGSGKVTQAQTSPQR